MSESTAAGVFCSRRVLAIIAQRACALVPALLVNACEPTEIAENRFQALAQTCYEFPGLADAGLAGQSAFNAGLIRPEGCEDPDPAAAAGAGGRASGTGSAAAGGAPPATGSGGQGGAGVDGTGAVGGSIGSADAGNVGGSGGEQPQPLSEACSALAAKRNFVGMTDDMAVVLALFAAPVAVGGCQNDDGEGGCHEAGTTSGLDLVTPDVTARLRGGLYTGTDAEYECRELASGERTWITVGGDETTSFLWRKVNSDYFGEALEQPPCGDSMPSEPGTVESLDATDRQCILQWVRMISANGG